MNKNKDPGKISKVKSRSKKINKHTINSEGDRSDVTQTSQDKKGDSTSTMPQPTLTSSQSNRPSPTAWFTTEIQQMMFGFGDCRSPLYESAALIEIIVHQQMVTLLQQACEIAVMRNGRFISLEDFLFLMRKDKVKLKRLIKHMSFKDRSVGLRTHPGEDEDNHESSSDGKQPPKKKKKICYDFLSSIDHNGELLLLFEDDGIDDIKMERALRAEQNSKTMDTQQYLEFCEARQASFAPKYKPHKFKDWLMIGVNVDPKPNPLAIEVLCYLAYETVAQIVDFALLARKDLKSSSDPLSKGLTSSMVNYYNLHTGHSIQQRIAQEHAAAMKSPSHAGSPSATPPSTPTTPSPMVSPTMAGLSSPSALLTATASKSKSSKKRKKSGSSTNKELLMQEAIQPSEILEAIRRFTQTKGPFAVFSKSPMVAAKRKMFCM